MVIAAQGVLSLRPVVFEQQMPHIRMIFEINPEQFPDFTFDPFRAFADIGQRLDLGGIAIKSGFQCYHEAMLVKRPVIKNFDGCRRIDSRGDLKPGAQLPEQQSRNGRDITGLHFRKDPSIRFFKPVTDLGSRFGFQPLDYLFFLHCAPQLPTANSKC